MPSFKPMVKMMTTEPSVILKLKKGGHVAMPKGKGGDDFKPMQSSMPTRGTQVPEEAAAPKKPSMAARRMAMKPAAGALPAPMMKKGGKADVEKVEKELKAHAEKPASKAHAGLKTGGVVKGAAGYKTGGVACGQGGYKEGGKAKKYARGGEVVDDGKAEKMPQGRKKPSAPVRINELAGTFKKGGKIVKKADGGMLRGQGAMTDEERALMKAKYDEANGAVSDEEKAMLQAAAMKGMGSVTDYDRKMMQEAGRTITPMTRKKGGKC